MILAFFVCVCVFFVRVARHINLFAALTGAGAQLCVVMVSLLLCALLGVFRATKRGSILTCILVLYSMTAWVAGLMSARYDCAVVVTGYHRK